MSKYTPPPVTFRDVLACLPRLRGALTWTVYLSNAPGAPERAYACVGLGVAGNQGYHREYKRWGREVSTKNPTAVMTAFLVAAQEAALWVEPISPEELVKLVCWQTDTPRP